MIVEAVPFNFSQSYTNCNPDTISETNASAKYLIICLHCVFPRRSYDSYCLSNCYDAGTAGPGVTGKPGGARWEKLRLIRAFDGGPEEAT